jgi:hypothetical protein
MRRSSGACTPTDHESKEHRLRHPHREPPAVSRYVITVPFFVLYGNLLCYAVTVGIVDRRQELFENIVRLRRVGRALPASRDLSCVRLTLEQELGSTVSKRLAARLLGVSHTALARWVNAGDLPVVSTPDGRKELPVPVLLDLYEEVRGEQPKDGARYTLAPAMRRRREAARQLHVEVDKGVHIRGGHGRASALSLAYHTAIAQRLSRPMVSEASHILFRWEQDGRIDPRYARKWEQLLAMPLPRIRRTITDGKPETDDLRQNSPFAGMLSEPERRQIFTGTV